MKKLNLWLLASLFMGGLALTACSSSDDDGGNGGNQPAVTPGTSVNPANMKMSALSGFVKDTDGYPLAGVTVTSGTESTRTDSQGGFVLSKVNTKKGRTVVKFEKDGYNAIVRAAENLDGDIWEVVMASTWSNSVTTDNYSSQYDRTIGIQNMAIGLQGEGYVKDANKTPFSGTVSSTVQYLSPDDKDFAEMMPGGDLAAVRSAENGGGECQLISYGMTKVDLTDYNTGEKLQLADGMPATLSFPVPEKFKDSTPDQIPLWSFNEETGLWEEEGIATYDAENDVYVGTVKHFSWVNLDYPEVRVRLKITVKDEKGNLIPGIKVDIDAQKNVTTSNKGVVSTYVPRNTKFYVTVHSEDYANYAEMQPMLVGPLSEDKSITITLPTVAHISGKVVNQGEGNNVATVWIEYNGKTTKRMHTDVDGQFYIVAPADYKGEAKLKVRGGDGRIKTADITLDGEDHAYTINFTSDINAGGKGTFKFKGKTFDFTFGEVSIDREGGAVIMGNSFYAETGYPDSEEGEMEGFVRGAISLSGYSAGKTSYTLGEMDYIDMNSEGQGGYMSVMFVAGASVTITQNGDTYRIQASGKAMGHGEEFGWNDKGDKEENIGDATLDITVPVYARGNKLSDVTPANNPLPSWAPILKDTPAKFAIAVTESPAIGKGGVLMYYADTLTVEDYNELKVAAVKTFGDPVSYYDYEGSSNAMFYKDGKYLNISFNNYYTDTNLPDFMGYTISSYNLTYAQSRIGIVAYDGYTLYTPDGRKMPKKRQ